MICIVQEQRIWNFNLIRKLSWDSTNTNILTKLNVLINIKWTSSRNSYYWRFRPFAIFKFRTFIYCQITLLLYREKTSIDI